MGMQILKGLGLALALAGPAVLTLAPPSAAEEASAFSDAQKQELGGLIRDYLMKNPEVLIEVSIALEAKRSAEQAEVAEKALAEQADAIFDDPTAAVIGNPNGKIQIVEFFDYNCGYCRRAMNKVLALTEANKEVKVIFKEMPVLGEASASAAVASLAAVRQDKFLPFHRALMTYDGRVSEEAIQQAAKTAKLDLKKFEADRKDPALQAAIDKNLDVSHALFIDGTPSFIIGDQIVRGWNEAEIDRLIAEASKS